MNTRRGCLALGLAIALSLPGMAGAEPRYADILLNDGPVAEAGPDRTAAVGDSVAFDGGASTDSDGSVAGAWWDFGDGTTAQGTTVSHSYTRAGQYLATLTAHDDLGHMGMDLAVVTIGTPPEALREELTIVTEAGDTLHGVVLRPDVPVDVPVILEYSPYPTVLPFILVNSRIGSALARSGFAVATVEAPGTGASTGVFDFFGEGAQQAGVDVVEDLAGRTWSTGDVGLVGYSGPGILGALVAARNPAHLRASAFAGIYGDLYRDWFYPGGVPNSYMVNFVAGLAGFRYGFDPVGGPQETANDLSNFLSQPLDGEYWRTRSPAEVIDDIQTPVFLQTAWNDLYPREAIWMGTRLAHPSSRIEVYPGPHVYFDPVGDHVERPVRAEEFSTSLLDRGPQIRLWFERFLMSLPNGVESRPRIAAYETAGGLGAAWSLGRGAWRAHASWPPQGTGYRRLYLHEGGTLSEASPGESEEPTLYAYDPTVGATDPSWWDWATSTNGFRGSPPTATRFHFAADDQAVEDARSATFTTAPFGADRVASGPFTASLWISPLGPGDPDVVVRVQEVWPDGSSHFLNKGLLRTSHRAVDETRSLYAGGELVRPFHPHDDVAPDPTEPVRLDIEIWPISNRFEAGTQLRLSVSLANSGYAWLLPQRPVPAVRILHDAGHQSFLLIPEVV